MRDFRDAKAMARTLRSSLAKYGAEITHAQSLELIAQTFGQESWNVLAAKTKAPSEPLPITKSADLFPRLAQVELGCTDLDEARAFYCDVLGLEFIDTFGDSLFVRCGEVSLIVQQGANPRRGRPIYFSGDGRIHEVTQALRDQGVGFEPRRIARNHQGHDVWLGFFDDPWGNPLAVLANMPIEQQA